MSLSRWDSRAVVVQTLAVLGDVKETIDIVKRDVRDVVQRAAGSSCFCFRVTFVARRRDFRKLG
jgi:hypothetical protein